MSYHPAGDINSLVKAFSRQEQVDSDKLTDVICRRTNSQLKKLQESYAENCNADSRNGFGQPTALITFLSAKISGLVDPGKDYVIEFVSRVLEDPYLRESPAERDESEGQDGKRAASDVKKLKKKFQPAVFVKVFLTEKGRANLNFADIQAINEKFGDDPSLEDMIMDEFTSPFQTLCLGYIQFALG